MMQTQLEDSAPSSSTNSHSSSDTDDRIRDEENQLISTINSISATLSESTPNNNDDNIVEINTGRQQRPDATTTTTTTTFDEMIQARQRNARTYCIIVSSLLAMRLLYEGIQEENTGSIIFSVLLSIGLIQYIRFRRNDNVSSNTSTQNERLTRNSYVNYERTLDLNNHHEFIHLTPEFHTIREVLTEEDEETGEGLPQGQHEIEDEMRRINRRRRRRRNGELVDESGSNITYTTRHNTINSNNRRQRRQEQRFRVMLDSDGSMTAIIPLSDSNNNNTATSDVNSYGGYEHLSFQAQIAWAIMESQRHILLSGGYGHPDGDFSSGEQGRSGISDKAKGHWINYKYGDDTKNNHDIPISSDTKNLEGKSSDSISGDSISKTKSSSEEDQHSLSCCICLSEYAVEDRLTKVSCGHIYHTDCISTWCNNSIRCPLCNNNLEQESG